MEYPILSIYIATYNHEKYITQALDSVFMQETNYSYEVIVGEDCSTDNTRSILKEYENLHHELVEDGVLSVIYRDHNMYRENPSNIIDLIQRCRGKYIIALEGDDYWTDKNKIQSQVDFLEKNPDYIATAHRCIVVDENSKMREEDYPDCREKDYTLQHFMANKFPGQTTTVLYRNIYKMGTVDTSIFSLGLMPGDKLRNFVLLINGRIRCFPQKMSAYRHVVHSGDSWSAIYDYEFETEFKFYSGLLDYANNQRKSEFILAAEALVFRCLAKGVKRRAVSISDFYKYVKCLNHKLFACSKWIKYKFFKDFLKKEYWY